jgi:hypothetical protein
MFLTPKLKEQVVRSYGNFQLTGVTGLLTVAAAGSDIASFRWGSTTKDCIVWFVRWWWYLTTGFTAAQISNHALYKATAFSVSPSGGTDLLPAAGASRRNSKQASSDLTAFQIATTGALTTGTRTLDALPTMQRGAWCAAATLQQLAEPVPGPAWEPLYLTTNEGWVIQNIAVMGAAGVQKFHVEVAWSEIVPDSMYLPNELAI